MKVKKDVQYHLNDCFWDGLYKGPTDASVRARNSDKYYDMADISHITTSLQGFMIQDKRFSYGVGLLSRQ